MKEDIEVVLRFKPVASGMRAASWRGARSAACLDFDSRIFDPS